MRDRSGGGVEALGSGDVDSLGGKVQSLGVGVGVGVVLTARGREVERLRTREVESLEGRHVRTAERLSGPRVGRAFELPRVFFLLLLGVIKQPVEKVRLEDCFHFGRKLAFERPAE